MRSVHQILAYRIGILTFVCGFSIAAAQVPTISSFSPTSGPIGTTVTITGANFSTTAGNNIVFFGAVKGTVTAATSTSLSVTVPTGATYQPITVTVNGLTGYSRLPFIVTFPGGGAITSSSFLPKVDYTTGSTPLSVSIGDLDGDGKPDLAVANESASTVSVFRNTSTSGTISFASKVDNATGSNPRIVAVGDIDGDGKPDLAVANVNSSTVSVLRNTSTSGTISFASKVDYATGSGPVSVAIGDVDGDGKPDLVAANWGNNTVSVLRNTSTSGTISFASKVDYGTGTNPLSVAIGDLDGDEKPDLAVANNGSSTVSVLRNTSTSGTISFAAKIDFPTGTNPWGVAIGDVDGDGKPDLAVGFYSSSTVSVFRNTSTSGTISFASKVDYATGTDPLSVAIGDLDGDEKPDLAVTNYSSNTVSVFRNTSTSGTISFASKVDYVTGNGPGSVAVGDIDGDAKPDLAVANESASTVSVLRNVIGPAIAPTVTSSAASSVTSSSATLNGSVNPNGVATTAYFEWGTSSTLSTFTATTAQSIGSGTTAVSVSANLSGLSANTTYYYRVVGQNSVETSRGSIVSLTTTVAAPPTAPTLSSPTNGSTNQNTRPTLAWSATSGATAYHLQVSQSSSFSTTVFDDTTITATSRQAGPLQNNRTHYWRVRAKNASGWSAYSSTFSFSTIPAPDYSTVAVRKSFSSPGSRPIGLAWDGSHLWMVDNLKNVFKMDTSGNVLHTYVYPGYPDGDLSWDGTGLWIDVGNKIKVDTLGKPMDTLRVYHWALSGFDWDGKYFWVSDYNSSLVYKHTRDGKALLNFGVSISFARPNSLSYDGGNLWIGHKSVISKYSTIGQLVYSAAVPNASSNGTGYVAWDGESLWFAQDDQFTIYRLNVPYVHETPAAPTLNSPADGQIDQPSTLTLQWNAALDATRYRLQVSTSSSFLATVVDDSTITETSKSVGPLVNGTTYYWRVRAGNSVGWGSFSGSWRFTTTGAASPVVTIADFTPKSGPIGTTVTITGANFSTTAGNNIVFFGAVKGTVTAATSTSLSVTVPTGATYQPITVTVNGLTGYSRLPFIVTFPGGGAITSSSFLPKVDYTTGTGPLSVSIGELDGDGKPDLAVANLSSNTVSVLRNTSTSGTISFASKVDYATGSYPQSVSIGDLDGDGKPDLAVANNLSNTVSVLRNTSTSGSISFASKVDFTTGGGPYSVAVGDVDGDGKPDLAVANRSSSTVSVFRNTSTSGTISFAPKVDYATGSWPASVAIGDVDGDGKPDLAVANWGSSTVSVFRNTSTSGTISFASKVDYVTGSGPESVAVGDIDGDGKPDLAVANYSSSTVSVFRDTSTSGTISFASKVDYATGSNPESVTIGDIDGDGKPDLAVGSWTSHTVSVFRNTSTSGTISFASKVDYATGTNPSSVAIGDLDGDGKPDLAVANVNSHTFSVLRNVIGSAISPTVTTSAASSMTSSSATLNGNVNPNGAATTAYFEWGTSSTLATSTATTSQSVGSGTTPVSVTASLTGLTANTTYYYRVVGQNSAGTQRGSIISFTTRTTTTGITVRVVSPNGGESWNEDMNHGFRWEASDTTGKTIRRIQILLSLNNGATYSVIHDSIPNTGSRGWRVPRSPSDQARVRIVAWNSDGQSASAQSEQAFVIQDVETFVYRTGNVNHTIRNDGFTGSGGSTYDPKEPSLEYPPDSKRHYLYLGQLLFGAVLPSGDTLMTLGYEDNFRPIEPIKITTRADGSETITRFESKKFPGLVVSQYTNAPQGESYIIAMWRFFNTSAGPMNGVILGTFHDMDINDYALNLTGFESANRIGYMFDGKGEWNGYAGVRALSHVPIFRRWGGNVIPEPRIAGQFYQAIFKSTSDDPTGDPPADYRIATLTSPTMLAPGDSITFAYALAIGDGLLGLRNVADRAQQKWNDIAGDIFTVQTGNAANITAKSAELFGYVTPGSTNVQAWFEYGTSATLSTYSSTTPKQVFFSPSAVSFSDGVTNLSTGTRYYFRVAAQRGISIQRGSIATFLTIPGTPTLDSPSNNATGQSTSPTLSWNSTTGATSYRLQVSTSSSFATTTFDDSTLSGTSRQVGPLPSGTLHFWRVNAKNVSGSGDWSFPFQFTTAAAGLTTPTLVSPSNGSSNQPTTLTLSWSTVSGATTYRLQVSTSSGFATTIVDDSTLTTTSRQVGPLANNTTYYWRVSAKGTAATSSFTTAWSFSTLSSVTVATPSPVSFPSNPTSSTDYRLFSMPGTSLLTVGDIVSGSQKIDWKMFRDNGAASNYLVELSSVSPLSTGEGYWLLKKGALTVSRSVSMPPLSSDGTYGISLHSGWNIIGNPFDKNVSWGAVLAANGLLQSVQLIDYFGSYGSTSVLEPFRGYYFDNRTSALSSLKIPYPFGLQKTQTEDRPAVDWRLQLIFESDINRDPENYIGIAASARDGFDELETRKPPLFLDQGFLYFSRPEWDPEYSRFSSDYRPSLGEGQTWDFEVSNPRMTVGKVQIRGMEKIPSDYSVLLVNPFNTEPFDLRANDTYVYRTVSERMAFTLIVGRKEFLDEQLARLLPEEFELVQNFPNPFNASTSISIKLPRDADIRLEVYSLLGQHIRTLAAGTTRAGVHTYVWSGDDHTASIVTSGVYFCRLSVVGSLVKSKSMLFVK